MSIAASGGSHGTQTDTSLCDSGYRIVGKQ